MQDYLIDRNASGAAARAGYSKRAAGQVGHVLLKSAEVARAVRANEVRIAEEADISRRNVMDGLQEAIDIARTRADPAAMIVGWREIAKMCGYYAPERKQVQLSADGWALQNEIERLSDAELLKLIAQGDVPSTEHLVPSTVN